MRLGASKTKVLSDISRDVAQVALGSVFVGPLLGGTAKPHILIIGITLTLVTWVLSVALVRET